MLTLMDEDMLCHFHSWNINDWYASNKAVEKPVKKQKTDKSKNWNKFGSKLKKFNSGKIT